MDLPAIFDFLNKGGMLAVTLLIIFGGAKRYWVWGWLYQEISKDRDEWKLLALDGMKAAKSAVAVAERVAP